MQSHTAFVEVIGSSTSVLQFADVAASRCDYKTMSLNAIKKLCKALLKFLVRTFWIISTVFLSPLTIERVFDKSKERIPYFPNLHGRDTRIRMSSNITEACTSGNITDCPIFGETITNHGDPDLFCRPAKWTDVLVFFLGNYVAHVATVHSSPGQSVSETILFSIVALFLPSAGILKACQAIYSQARFAPTELQRAARAGALFVIHKIPTENSTSCNDDDIWGSEQGMTGESKLKHMLKLLN